MKNKDTIEAIQDIVRTYIASDHNQYWEDDKSDILNYVNELNEINTNSEDFLALWVAGVDNWNGYDNAMDRIGH